MDVPLCDRLNNVTTVCTGTKCNRSSCSPEDEPLTWSSTASKSKFHLKYVDIYIMHSQKDCLQTFRVPRWWILMTNFSAGWTFWFVMKVSINIVTFDGMSWSRSDIHSLHWMDRDKLADPVMFHFAPSNFEMIIKLIMQPFYHCEHVIMLTSAFQLF